MVSFWGGGGGARNRRNGSWLVDRNKNEGTNCECRHFAPYIIPHYTHIRKHMYIVKIICIMPYKGNNIRNANINLREIDRFRKFTRMYTHKNIQVHSINALYPPNPAGFLSTQLLLPFYLHINSTDSLQR